MTFTIDLESDMSVRFQTLNQGVNLTRRQLEAMDDLDAKNLSLDQMHKSGILTGAQVEQARKKLLRQMLAVIGGAQ